MKRGEIKFEDSFNHYDVFKQELGLNNSNKGLCVWHKEKTPSLSVFQSKDGQWLCKCFGCNHSSNLWGFLMKKYDFDYKQAVEYVKNGNFKLNKPTTIINKSNKENLIEFSTHPFTKEHIQYWEGKYGLNEEFLNSYNIWAVKAWAWNEKLRKIPNNTIVTAYYCEELDKTKILQVGSNISKQDKWKNTVPNDWIWFMPTEKCNKLWVCKAVKDALCLIKHYNFCAVAVQNESGAILDKNMEKLLKLINNPKDLVINFGSDEKAVNQCIPVQQKYKTSYFNMPKYMLKLGVQDIPDAIAEFGVEIVRNELKKKKFI